MSRCLLVFIFTLSFSLYCRADDSIIYHELQNRTESLTLHEGILCPRALLINYHCLSGAEARIELSEPVMIAQAEQKEKWGYFQFPKIGKANDGILLVSWQMREDSHKTYGIDSDRKDMPMMSHDGGNSWIPQDKNYSVFRKGYNICMHDGDILQVSTPASKNINSYSRFPKKVGTLGARSFYPEENLPNDLQGVYFSYKSKAGKTEKIQAKLNDPGYLRYSIDGLMPIVWWGNIQQMADRSLVAGIYPGYYQDSIGQVMPSGISFYHSVDKGHTWDIWGKIPFPQDSLTEKYNKEGFTEPAFEILSDSTFICVIRTGSSSPMYKSFSYDRGRTWTNPEAFTPNGVKPQLLHLENGVLVLASGRPGVQVRFSLDGTGKDWTEPIDMIPFMKDDGSFIRDVSCGYTSLVEADFDSFYIVYSDFTTKNKDGDVRKSIWSRKITVKRKRD